MASTRLTNAERDAAVTAALKDAFSKPLAVLHEGIQQYARDWVAEHHPIFAKLNADKDARRYLGRTCRTSMRMAGFRMQTEAGWLSCDIFSHQIFAQCDQPTTGGEMQIPAEHPLHIEYIELREKYIAAHSALVETFAAYTIREKLESDLPELVKYLPPRPSPVRSLTVPADTLRNKLSAVGIPPAATEKE